MIKKLLVILTLFTLATNYLLPATVYAQQSLPTTDEQAIYNISTGTLPEGVVGAPSKDESLITQALAGISNFLANFRAKFYTQSERIARSEVPEEVLPKSNNIIDNLKGFLSGSTGLYGSEMPELQNPPSDIRGYEKTYEQTNFPDGISPITGQ